MKRVYERVCTQVLEQAWEEVMAEVSQKTSCNVNLKVRCMTLIAPAYGVGVLLNRCTGFNRVKGEAG